MIRRTYGAYTLFNGNVCNKNWSLDSAGQFIQQTKKNNNGSTCTTGSTCNTRAMIIFTGSMAAFSAVIALQASGYDVNYFYDACDTSNYHRIRAPNELVGSGGGTTNQAIFNGAMCLTVAIPAVCLVFMTGVIQSVYAIGSR